MLLQHFLITHVAQIVPYKISMINILVILTLIENLMLCM